MAMNFKYDQVGSLVQLNEADWKRIVRWLVRRGIGGGKAIEMTMKIMHRWQPNGLTPCGLSTKRVPVNAGHYLSNGVTCKRCKTARTRVSIPDEGWNGQSIGHPKSSNATRSKMSDPLKPTLTILIKLGSIAIHAEEMLSSDGNQFDRFAIEQLLADPEIQEWFKEMDTMPFLPVKRIKRRQIEIEELK